MFKYRELLSAHLIVWFLYGLLEHISHITYGDDHFWGSFGGALLGCLLTSLLAYVYHVTPKFFVWLKIVLFCLLTFLAAVIWHNVSRFLHQRETLEQVLNTEFTGFFAGTSYTVLLFATWAGLYFGGLFYLQKQQQEKNALRLSEQAKEAKLQSLRYQLNPHFLFNVLNSIDVAVQDKDNDVAHNMLIKLSRLLRVTLEADATHKIELKQEISLLDDFVAIEQERYIESIKVKQSIPESLMPCLIPSMILQPLIENAIKYTWHASHDKTITLQVDKKNNYLCIEIDNPYEANSAASNTGTNTGLNNVSRRLAAIYEGEASLNYQQKKGRFRATLLIPIEEA